ncbi:MAG: CheR family methyltransferase, partial [Terriglobales bacterium]
MGVSFSGDRLSELSRKIPSLCAAFGYASGDEFVHWLIKNEPSTRDLGILAEHLTIGETYFFRDPELFDHLRKELLPELLRERTESRSLKIWSAGCCSGEELYSIAMLLHELLPGRSRWQIHLTGTDINPAFLEKARSGVYRDFSLRATPDQWRERYFEPLDNGGWQLCSEIKEMVSFQWLNLVAAESKRLAPLEQDIILCRNVLMYFNVPAALQAMELLESRLSECGFLFVSPFDISLAAHDKVVLVTRPGLVYLQRRKPEPVTASQCELPVITAVPASAPGMTPFTRAMYLYTHARYEEAVALLSRVSQPDGDTLLLLCRCLANHGELEHAMTT